MKILLAAINAKYIHSNPAVYSLRAYAKEYRKEIHVSEFTINLSKDYILQEIYRQRPDVLCFSCYIWNIRIVKELIRDFRKVCPSVPIWAGGPEVSYEAEAFLKENPDVCGVMIGEGEQTFYELCACGFGSTGSGAGAALSQIHGIAFRTAESKGITVNRQREPLDFSRIPFAYDPSADFSNRIIYYESSRGCPFSCSYCLSSADRRLRFRDMAMVKKELQFFLDRKVPQVKFVDRTFNCNHAHAMEIWQFIKTHDNGITNFHFEISADLLNEEELGLMSDMRPGLMQLEIGVQSVNKKTICEIHRSMDLEALKQAVLRIQQGGNIHEHLDLIAGLPYEDYDSFRHSFNEIYALKPDQLQLGFLKVLKGSYLYEHAKEYGIVYHTEAPYEVLSTNWLSFDDVIRMKQAEEMLEAYYNSGQFEVTMKIMECLFTSAFDFFQNLGRFYEEKGYFAMSHSRIRRCEILLEFLEDCHNDGWNADAVLCVRESLTFDLYYRENCKSRPSWAPSLEDFREMAHYYCKNGKLSHVEPFHYRFPLEDERSIRRLPMRQDLLWAYFHYDERNPLNHQAKVEYVLPLQV